MTSKASQDRPRETRNDAFTIFFGALMRWRDASPQELGRRIREAMEHETRRTTTDEHDESVKREPLTLSELALAEVR